MHLVLSSGVLKEKHLKVLYLSHEKGTPAFHNANGYLMMFLTSCEVRFFIFILFCLRTTIRVMYVSNYYTKVNVFIIWG